MCWVTSELTQAIQAIELDCQSSMSEKLELLRSGFADVDGIIRPIHSFNGIQRDIQSSSAHTLVDSTYSMCLCTAHSSTCVLIDLGCSTGAQPMFSPLSAYLGTGP